MAMNNSAGVMAPSAYILASERSMRASFHCVTAICSTRDFSIMSWGIQAAESWARCWSNLSFSSGVLGPVDFFALLRLARICLIVAIVTLSVEQSQFGAGKAI